jgi:hypothetical protein
MITSDAPSAERPVAPSGANIDAYAMNVIFLVAKVKMERACAPETLDTQA